MANICCERVVVVTDSKDYMAGVLEKMCNTVLASPVANQYFSADEVDACKGDADALFGLVRRTVGTMNLLCLFAEDPDTRSEGGWTSWCIEKIGGFFAVSVEIDLKWSGSEQPGQFCSHLDAKHCAYSISESGEAYEWEGLFIDGKWIDGADVAETIDDAARNKHKTKSMKKLAYYANLAGISPDLYGECDW